ncbi:MAG: DUF4238 domain-containing protein [Clostridiales bacterium]|nr:DUF4238 domain-containing protein [Clostridiales bacterium]
MKIQGHSNSHIQLPKSVLASFSTTEVTLNDCGKPLKSQFVYKMTLDGIITKENIKKTNTEFGYYEDIIEQYLNTVETNFGETKKKIIDSAKNNEIELKLTDIDAVKKYCIFCLLRSPQFVAEVKGNSIMMDALENAPQNAVIYSYLQNPKEVDEQFENYTNITFIRNESKINFILPQLGAIGIKDDSKREFILPITPTLAIMLTDRETIVSGTFYIGKIDETNVDNLNKLAIYEENKNNNEAIYAQNKEDLLRYLPFLHMLN